MHSAFQSTKKKTERRPCLCPLPPSTLTDTPAGVDGGHLGGSPEPRKAATRLPGVPAATATAALAAGDGEALPPPFDGDDNEAFLLSGDWEALLLNGDDGTFLFSGDCEQAVLLSGDGGVVAVSSSLQRSARRKLLTSSAPASCTLYHPTFLLTTVPVGPGACEIIDGFARSTGEERVQNETRAADKSRSLQS